MIKKGLRPKKSDIKPAIKTALNCVSQAKSADFRGQAELTPNDFDNGFEADNGPLIDRKGIL